MKTQLFSEQNKFSLFKEILTSISHLEDTAAISACRPSASTAFTEQPRRKKRQRETAEQKQMGQKWKNFVTKYTELNNMKYMQFQVFQERLQLSDSEDPLLLLLLLLQCIQTSDLIKDLLQGFSYLQRHKQVPSPWRNSLSLTLLARI